MTGYQDEENVTESDLLAGPSVSEEEARYAVYCREHGYDPETVEAALAYEADFEKWSQP